jgi:hypothetical protein
MLEGFGLDGKNGELPLRRWDSLEENVPWLRCHFEEAVKKILVTECSRRFILKEATTLLGQVLIKRVHPTGIDLV